MGRSSNAHNFLISRTERFEIFTICRRPPVLQTDARVGMMKIVVRETEARKSFGVADFHTPITRYRNIVAGGCAWQYLRLCWPYPRAKSKSDQSLRKARTTAIPICLGPYGKTVNIIIAVRGARTMIIFTPVKALL